MTRKKPNLDGVVYTRKRRNLVDYSAMDDSKDQQIHDSYDKRSLQNDYEAPEKQMKKNKNSKEMSDELDQIQDDSSKKPKSKKRILRRVLKVSFVAVLIVGSFIGFKFYNAINNIIIDNDASALGLQKKEIKTTDLNFEGESRVNILLIGIGGENHQGGQLSDVNMVISFDPENNDVAMLSIPRDLYLSIPNSGKSRINAAHAFGEQKKGTTGPKLLQETIEQMLNIKIHYFARLDFKGFEQAIDAVGGVEVNVEKSIYDPFIDFRGRPFSIKTGVQKLDGATSLAYARSRKTTSDFDRARRQQEILVALKNKVLSLGTFSNPLTLSRLFDSAGSHVSTNIQVSEMLQMLELSSKIKNETIRNYVIDNAADGFLSSRNINGAAVLVPKNGIDEFDDLRDFVSGELFRDGFLARENKTIAVLNGSGESGIATKTADRLKALGYNVTVVDDAPNDQLNTIIFDSTIKTESEYTMHLLQKRFTGKVSSEIPLELQTIDADILIVLGQDFTGITGISSQ